MPKIDRFDLLSCHPVEVSGVGPMRSPTLREIARMGNAEYQACLSLFLTTAKDLICASLHLVSGEDFDKLPQELRRQASVFRLLTASKKTRELLQRALSLFIAGELQWQEGVGFLVNPAPAAEGGQACEGVVNAENFDAVADLCLQFAAIESEKPGGKRFANEHSKKLYEKFLQKKEAYRRARSQKPNPDYQLGNLISALAAAHPSLNILNIWDLTVYQLHDQITRQTYMRQIVIREMNYAAWGGESDPAAWFRSLDK